MRARAWYIPHPNTITALRIAATPAIILTLFVLGPVDGAVPAFCLFALAALSDGLDGYIARRHNLVTAMGRMLDPIADKLLVGAATLMLIAQDTISGPHVLAAVIIVAREIVVSGLRELLATLDALEKVKVTRLAKWKTGAQMVAIACLMIAPAISGDGGIGALVGIGEGWAGGDVVMQTGLALLWLAAIVTCYTGANYFMAGLDDIRAADGHRSGTPSCDPQPDLGQREG
ncbi:MAG: CDP-diacylglycerol--glycerol-3-phosphate 3-phosphatidyltransferase [Pseudomonadota bacterium]